MRVCFHVHAGGSFKGNIKRQISVDGIGDVRAVERVNVLARARSFDVIGAIHSAQDARGKRQGTLVIIGAQRKLFQFRGDMNILVGL